MNMNEKLHIKADVIKALEEDIGSGDITGMLIPEETEVSAQIITREPMILCGSGWVEETFYLLNPAICVQWFYEESQHVEANAVICWIQGQARDLLCAERTALNFLQTLSATATQTHAYAEKLSGSSMQLLDTRKTIPGLRYAQKYAVRCGGGYNHRLGLYDAFLIKENHIKACGSITLAIQKARELFPDKKLEVEVENLEEFKMALSAAPDIIMLDNFNLEDMQSAVNLRGQQKAIKIEISGNVNLENITDIARTGADFVSVGAITKHIRAIDLTLLLGEP